MIPGDFHIFFEAGFACVRLVLHNYRHSHIPKATAKQTSNSVKF